MQEKSKVKKRRKKTTTAFPKNTLKEALKIAESIQNNNAGKPYNRLDLARSLDYSPESSLFRTLITSSRRFGLTSGGYQADKISLTPLGVQIVAPKSDREKAEGLKKALFNIKLYKDFFQRFDGHKVPKKQYLKNTLNRDFGIPNEDTDECYDMIIKNAKELNIITEIKGSEYFQLSKLFPTTTEETMEEEEIEALPEEIGEVAKVVPKEAEKPIVFISHSKNKKIISQIEQILKFGQFDYKIAEKIETTAIPIPEKIFGLMRKCNCAIINVSADEEEKREDGTFGINQNVLIEIGAAFLLYNKKVILLVDKRVNLPSNLQGLYRCEYEGNELTFSTAMKLQEALSRFRD